MTNELTVEEKEAHRKAGIKFFNETWNYIDKKDRSVEEDEMMLSLAHTSRVHWILSDCPKVNIQRGFWILSRVYAILNRTDECLRYAKLTLDYTEEPTKENRFKIFDVAYANEAMARAYALLGEKKQFERYHEEAVKAAEKQEKHDKEYWDKDFASEPWNGMK